MNLIPFPLPSVVFAAGGRAPIDISGIPATLGGRHVTVPKITFDVQATPTLSGGSATAEELQGAVRNITIKDSVRTHFDGSFKSMRLFEALERGKLWAPEPDAAATTEAVNFQRTFNFAMPLFKKPSDFHLSAAALGQGSQIEISWGALVDVDALCTALMMTVQPIAWLQLTDDAKIAPILARIEKLITKDVPLTGEALYAFFGLCKSNAFAAIAAGDFANLQITAAGIGTTKQVHASAFTRAFHEEMRVAGDTQVMGEPRAVTDDNAKVIAGTALAAAVANIQPVIFSGHDQKLSKLQYAGQNELTIGWSGTASNGYGLISRIEKRTKDMEEQYIAVMSQKLGVALRAPKLDTESGREYATGPRARYLPLKFKY